MSHRTMHSSAAFGYAAPSPLPLPLPYLPPPPPPPLLPPPPAPLLRLLPPPSPAALESAGFQSRISPSILLIILILAVIFFVSGLLHLLVRFLFRPAPRDPGDAESGGGGDATAFQGQLQQLFHLHDAGVDQTFIDALPVFLYGAVVGGGTKEPFDCAVCLCEFADDDRLRLLPKCSHAFHVECIDTWLLSHSTCPLCRRSLLADFSPCGGGCSPLVFVLESGGGGSEPGSVLSDRLDGAASSAHLSLVMGQQRDEGAHCCDQDHHQKQQQHADVESAKEKKKDDEVVVPVKLGKFRSSQATESSSGGNPDGQDVRRCYSMGTYEYVMDQSSLLRVSVKPATAKSTKRPAARMPLPGRRVAMSECDCHSKREGFDVPQPGKLSISKPAAAMGGMGKKESFSVSKIWMHGAARRKEDAPSGSSSRRASSFRLPSALLLQRAASDVGAGAGAPKRRADVVSPVTESEYNVSAWDKSSAADWDVESAAARLTSRADETPSFARRTIAWIRGHL
ncbi:RING-H2 finger protein ATL13 [Brachypodium distachyon]|uniref:RING-type E3 ubiquitin transferase n=1 Tax=Brachypodium distachyon TaxID=15368 RepID=A0A0Q3HY88_BRADI|nr:RING-H2 finger protein ATL13 [Brachypodium distachyon]XP_024316184.1 RING-H2 finger protein ATL13 [Brachypodium distachyon]XP_024316185.1 RING-H2 finger protein ATL13 [Brachypodium distachyon]KQJ98490.1 hypothetical protein BRADI_3g37187v3 [Brachypodium distachyon]PNT68206.1 hypothetical protein BRADI_3g37187v3 [Brachypodium distachyon]PNT68207.1 hypothetical protein BRADI_3g37187v3 [Brachypodium distachyon]PNT68208.1 hypothetical protein BRADI_3g37187v3 [Brachypodium distachyon]PNT68209.|eukprot:XP_003574562.1 RING-H2 finger protein ATL13 [Brachypodium distachyon]